MTRMRLSRKVTDMERLTYTVPEVIAKTGLSRTTIWRHVLSGRLPSVKVGGRRLISHRDLLTFVSGPTSEREEQV
jgi:excisionase family DNA binding protein